MKALNCKIYEKQKRMIKYFIKTQRENKVCKTQAENGRINEKVNGQKREVSKSIAVVFVQSFK